MPLELNAAQVQRLQAIALERDLKQLAEVVSSAFPEVAPRLGERFAGLILHATQRGAAYGLTHALGVARLLACWCVLGAEFETKAAYAWALALLTQAHSHEGAKVFQLCVRVQEELGAPAAPAAPGGLPAAAQAQAQAQAAARAAAFRAGLDQLDQALAERGALGSLLPRELLKLGQPCDLDAIDLRPTEAPQREIYRVERGQWTRVATPSVPGQLTLRTAALAATAAEAGDRLPAQLHLLMASRNAAPQATRLRLRISAAACCDQHPLVQHNAMAGVSEWRGEQALELALAVTARAPLPGLAVPDSPNYSQLSLASCGLRASGTGFGEQTSQIAAYPAEQQLLAWQRSAMPLLEWSEQYQPAPPKAAVSCRFECDGLAQDASVRVQALQALDQQLLTGLNQLFRAWCRDSGVTQPLMSAEPAVLSGQSGVTWGWVAAPQGLLQAPVFRLAGALDLVACQLNLRLSGNWALNGSLSRLTLLHQPRASLQGDWLREAAEIDLATALQPASVSFRQSFVLQLDVQPSRDLATACAVGPVLGEVVGSCGLRPRPGQAGLEWFARLSVNPLSVALQVSHPLLGPQQMKRTLLPALDLLDWSMA